ncbi:hypothetical protein Q4F19_03790 [Sphingomonas sp. BIUV-7]|uniref:Uncharacterized protein n=1 Tax=Sphingomonas natans TaxID=3063330 RepID=A0ABT8Y5A1_9SPHN|nr:hypothetical protein [Sphingomonas sp. BIUV-7]MDO6413497.1 hypothetical protein [Sphingomonas sp. BIUV-7]
MAIRHPFPRKTIDMRQQFLPTQLYPQACFASTVWDYSGISAFARDAAWDCAP